VHHRHRRRGAAEPLHNDDWPLTRGPDRDGRQTGCRGPGRHTDRTPLGTEPVAVSTNGGLRRTPTWCRAGSRICPWWTVSQARPRQSS